MDKKHREPDCPGNPERRRFLQAAALTVGTTALLPMTRPLPSRASDSQNKANGAQAELLQMAGYKLDRTEALISGKVTIDGYEINFTESKIGDININVFSGPQSYDVTEIGLHPFMMAYGNENFRDYLLLPIFPIRLFRHKSIFIRTDRGIERPQDLKGKKVSTAGYSSTSLTWIRGMLSDEYGVKPEDLQWVISQKDSSAKDAGKVSAQESVLPEGVPIEKGPEGVDESDLLDKGMVDCCFHAGEPRAFTERRPNIDRLFPDSRKTEQEYFKNTGIFPIMHAVAIKKSFAEQKPEIVPLVFQAYSQSKQKVYDYLAYLASIMDILPWASQEFEATKELMGENYFSYGIEPNRKSLEALFRYSYEQGLCSKHLKIEDVFLPDSLGLKEKG